MTKSLTAKAVKNAKPTDKRQEIPDGLLIGLYLVIQPSGVKSWAIRYRHAGTPRKLTLGSFAPSLPGKEPEPVLDGPLTLAGARVLARVKLHEVAAGQDPAATKKADKRAARDPQAVDRDLFEHVARQFIERYAKPKNRSWLETARLLGLVPDPAHKEDADGKPIPVAKRPLIVRGGVAGEWAGMRVQNLTRRDLIELLDGITDRGAPIVANRTLAALRKFFNWCIQRGIVEANPATGVTPPAPARSRDRVLGDSELRAVWKASDRLGHPFCNIVRTLILTGQRKQEVNGMRWSELDLDGKEPSWVIPKGRMKRDREHTVPLAPEVVTLLKSLPRIAGTDLVFTVTGTTPPSGFSRAKTRIDAAILKAAQEAAADAKTDPAKVKPIPHWTFHDFRRTVASGMARLGIDLPVIEKVLAHETGSFGGIVGVYQKHTYAKEKRAALEQWATFIMTLTKD